MGKHDDGRRYLNHSYHVPVAASKSPDRLDVYREQDGESDRCHDPYKHIEANVKKTLDKQNIAEASSAIGVTLPMKNFWTTGKLANK